MQPAAKVFTRGFVALAAMVILLVACGSSAAAEPCWKRVQSDWTDNKRIDKTYKAGCYDKAVAKLPTDLRYYSDAPDTILAAKERMLRAQDRTPQSRSSDPPGSGNNSNTSNKGDGDSPLGAILNWGPSAADDVPLPLLIIAFLALLLMGAGAAGLVNRRLQVRRAGSPPDGPSPA